MISTEYFGNKLKKLRKERNMTQVQFADICGINQTQVTRYENGQNLPSGKMIERIAKALNVKMEVFNELNEISINSLDADYKKLRESLINPEQKLALRHVLRSFYLSTKTKLVNDESSFN